MSTYFVYSTTFTPGTMVKSSDINALTGAVNTAFTGVESAYFKLSGATSNVSAGGYKITSLGNATNPGDATNLSTVQSLISGGGTPGSIAITDLNYGTLQEGQVPMRVGTALVGASPVGSLLYSYHNLGGF